MMESPLKNEYTNFQVIGTPSVKLVEPTEYEKHYFSYLRVIVILGPTGAGKSSFIEALASNTSLGISSNRLEGFTQSISAYQLINVKQDQPMDKHNRIYLVDVPGFSDTKISEMKILSMLKDWIERSGGAWFERILYFMPINTPRLPGSQREVLRTFQALTGIKAAQGITVVTTMWDCLGSEAAKQRGECNFDQLRNEDHIDQGARIVRFYNTRESALLILDLSLQRFPRLYFNLRSFLGSHIPLRQTKFATNIHESLQTRLRNVHLELANIESELQGAAEQNDEQLRGVLIPQQEEAQKLLAMFEQDLCEFGDPPHPKPVMKTLQLLNRPTALSSHHDTETQDMAPATAPAQTEDAPLPLITTSHTHQHSELTGIWGLPNSHSESVVATAASGEESAGSHVQPIKPAIATSRTEESPLQVIAASPEDLPTTAQTDAAPPFVWHEGASPHSPTSIVQLHPLHMLILKGLLRRLIQAAKHRGKKWFKKTKD